tara:strand:- start:1086 stop:1394 length:309 start_codon:yes stop_codon:yes gene_type:complete
MRKPVRGCRFIRDQPSGVVDSTSAILARGGVAGQLLFPERGAVSFLAQSAGIVPIYRVQLWMVFPGFQLRFACNFPALALLAASTFDIPGRRRAGPPKLSYQ